MAERLARYLRNVAISVVRAADRRLASAVAALFMVIIVSTVVLGFTYRLGGGRRLSLLTPLTSQSRR